MARPVIIMSKIVDSSSLNVTNVDFIGDLSDVLLMNDGTPVTSIDLWQARRKELFATAVEFQYGTLPPTPEFVAVDTLYLGAYGKSHSYRIRTGTKSHPISFRLKLMLPKKENISNTPWFFCLISFYQIFQQQVTFFITSTKVKSTYSLKTPTDSFTSQP